MFVVALILALVAGYCFAYCIVAKQVYKSNNYGDSMGEVKDFSRGTWYLVSSKDYKRKKRDWDGDRFLAETEARMLKR